MLHLFICILTFAGTNASAKPTEDVTLSGKLIFASKVKPGEAYLMVAGEAEAGLLKPKTESDPDKPEEKRELPPVEGKFRGYVSIGAVSGEAHSFSLDLPPGNYRFTAFVKNGEGDGPKCVMVTRNDRQVAMSCFPTKGDTICAPETVDTTKVTQLEFHCGDPAGAPSAESTKEKTK